MPNLLDELIQSDTVVEIYARICAHPLPKGIQSGELPKDIFIEFLRQDTYYLPIYTQSLEAAAKLFTTHEEGQLFSRYAKDSLAADAMAHQMYHEMLTRSMHAEFFSGPTLFQSKQRSVFKKNQREVNSACQRYTEHLQTVVAAGELAVIIASTLPCFWLYRELGRKVDVSKLDKSHPYQKWILSYADEKFYHDVDKMIGVFEHLAAQVSAEEKSRMMAAFIESMHCEWHFFDVAYHGEPRTVPQAAAIVL